MGRGRAGWSIRRSRPGHRLGAGPRVRRRRAAPAPGAGCRAPPRARGRPVAAARRPTDPVGSRWWAPSAAVVRVCRARRRSSQAVRSSPTLAVLRSGRTAECRRRRREPSPDGGPIWGRRRRAGGRARSDAAAPIARHPRSSRHGPRRSLSTVPEARRPAPVRTRRAAGVRRGARPTCPPPPSEGRTMARPGEWRWRTSRGAHVTAPASRTRARGLMRACPSPTGAGAWRAVRPAGARCRRGRGGRRR